MEDLYYLVAAAVGFWLGWQVNSWFTVRHVRSIMQDLGITAQQLQSLKDASADNTDPNELTVIQARVELMQGEIYCWLKGTEEFLGQAATPEAMIELLARRYQGHRIIIDHEDGAAIMGKGQITYDATTKELTRNGTDS